MLGPARHVAWRGVDEALAAPELQRAIDHVLAGPLVEGVTRALIERRVIERAVETALADGRAEDAVRQALASPAFERMVLDAVGSRLAAEVVDQMLASPAVLQAMTRQSSGAADQLVGAVRGGAGRLDDRWERRARSWVRRSPRAAAAPTAGAATRALGLAVDVGILQVGLLVATGTLTLIASLVGELRPAWLVGLLLGFAWALTVITYFTACWSTAGQTPGMRLLSVRVVGADGEPPGVTRSLLRLVGLVLAIIPLFAGFLPMLFDDRRRGLPDLLAGTVVLYDRPVGAPAGP